MLSINHTVQNRCGPTINLTNTISYCIISIKLNVKHHIRAFICCCNNKKRDNKCVRNFLKNLTIYQIVNFLKILLNIHYFLIPNFKLSISASCYTTIFCKLLLSIFGSHMYKMLHDLKHISVISTWLYPHPHI